jgi:hypothetical protein
MNMQYGCGQDAGKAHQKRMPRDFQDQIDLDDLKNDPHTLRSTVYAFIGVYVVPLLRYCFLEGDVLWILPREDGRTLRSFAYYYTLGETLI